MVNNIYKLHGKIKAIGTYVGSIPGGFKDSNMTLSKMVKASSIKLSDLEQSKDRVTPWLKSLQVSLDSAQQTLDTVQDELAEVQSIPSQIDHWMESTNKTLELLNKRLMSLKGFVMRGNVPNCTGKKNVSSNILAATGNFVNPSLDTSDVLYHQVLDLEEKIKILENRVVGAGVQLGNLVCQSFDDLLVWVRVKVPKGRFGLFVDNHSFLKFFSISGHIDTEVGTAAFSHSQRAGFIT